MKKVIISVLLAIFFVVQFQAKTYNKSKHENKEIKLKKKPKQPQPRNLFFENFTTTCDS